MRVGDGSADEGGGGESLMGNQEGKAGPCPCQSGTVAAPGIAARARASLECLPARLWAPPVPPATLASSPSSSCRAHWFGGGCQRSSPPAVRGFYLLCLGGAPLWDPQSHRPRPGPPLSSPGLPAFSLSQIQLLLRTAARVSSLEHRPERVTPVLGGLRLLAALRTGSA